MTTAKPNSLRVVLDTNVYFSAFTYPQGTPYKIWRHAVRRRYALLVSPAILREVAHVLRDYLDLPEPEIVAALKLVAKVAEIVTPKLKVTAIIEDDADNRILECAVAGKADLIVSGDNHLRSLKVFRGIAIVRPTDLLRILAA